MSALASGFPDAGEFYNVIPPKPRDLGEPFMGACYYQRRDICWKPSRAFEEWVVTDIRNDIITIRPMKRRWANDIRRVSLQVLKDEYKLCTRQRQRPGCS
jgi:hypothetical protein